MEPWSKVVHYIGNREPSGTLLAVRTPQRHQHIPCAVAQTHIALLRTPIPQPSTLKNRPLKEQIDTLNGTGEGGDQACMQLLQISILLAIFVSIPSCILTRLLCVWHACKRQSWAKYDMWLCTVKSHCCK